MENSPLIVSLIASNSLFGGILATAFWRWVTRIEAEQKGKATKDELNVAVGLAKKRLDTLEKDHDRNEADHTETKLRLLEMKNSVDLLKQGTELQYEHISKTLDILASRA